MELTDYSSLFKKVCKCKCHKLFRYKSLLENHYYIYEYEFKNNVIIFESERKLLKTSQLPCFIRIDCIRKIKETSTEKRQNSKRTSQTHIFQDICISAVLFTAIIVSISHRLYMSPLKVLRCKYFYFPQKWMKLEPFTSEILILLLKAFAVGYSSSHLISFYSNNESVDWNLTETKLDFCNLPSNYWKRKFKNNINLLNFKQIPSSTNIYYQNCNPKASFDFLMKVFEYVIQEIIRYLNEYLNRMRRKTQFILTILMLLQLLTTVSLTHCTTSSNQTREKIISTPSSFTSPILPEHMRAQLKQTFAFTSTTQSPLHTNSGSIETTDFKDQEEQVSARVISNRLSGGSSITNFFQQENNSKRDYNPYFASVGCYSCQKREQVKADTLESIKKHILLRLEMQTLPNITASSVPYTIIENFYRNFSYLSHKKSIFINEKNNDSKNNNSTYATPSIHLNQQTNNTEIPIHIDNRMQGDDPNIYSKENKILLEEYNKKSEQLSTDIMEEEFYSTVNSVYVFPTTPRMRHNRKAEILNFKFKNNEYSTVSQALLYVYIRGRDWIRENEPDLLKINNSIAVDRQDIKITINRVVRRFNSTLATHTINVTESKHRIPNGIGEWISIDVTQLVQDWLQNATTNQGIIIKSYESWMKPLINTGDSQNNKAFTVYIEILTKDNRKRRAKRNTSMNCSETDNEERCCRYPLVVNFEEFDWTWVVAPTSFNAYFCNGECKLGFLEKYPHTHLMQLSTAPQPCCSPTKMSPLLLLYFNTENTLVMSTIPNMAVEKCSCS